MSKSASKAFLSLKEWTSSLKQLVTSSGVSRFADAEILDRVKTLKSDLNVLDNAASNLIPTKTEAGTLLLNDKTLGDVVKIFNGGKLADVIKLSKLNVPINSIDESAFKTLTKESPYAILNDLDELISVRKKQFPELNVGVRDVSKLSAENVKKLSKMDSILRKAKPAAVIALTIGAVYVVADWITQTTKEREGCFMLTTLNGKTTSCKISAYTCASDDISQVGKMCTSVDPAYTQSNLALVYLTIASQPPTHPLYVALVKGLGYAAGTDLMAKINEVLTTKFMTLDSFWTSQKGTPDGLNLQISPCSLKNQNIENGIIPPCRLCDPTADPTSTKYINPNIIGDNITFQCVINPSILDTITDVVASTGIDLFGEISSTISGSFKYIGYGVLVLAIIGIIVLVVTRLLMKGRNSTEGVVYSTPQTNIKYKTF